MSKKIKIENIFGLIIFLGIAAIFLSVLVIGLFPKKVSEVPGIPPSYQKEETLTEEDVIKSLTTPKGDEGETKPISNEIINSLTVPSSSPTPSINNSKVKYQIKKREVFSTPTPIPKEIIESLNAPAGSR